MNEGYYCNRLHCKVWSVVRGKENTLEDQLNHWLENTEDAQIVECLQSESEHTITVTIFYTYV